VCVQVTSLQLQSVGSLPHATIRNGDCQRIVSGFPNLCNHHDLLYAATSLGLYRSTDAGASWTLDGLEGKRVRGVALVNDHPVGTAPRAIVGVDDAIKIYRKAP
jgi:hypothetical protein